MELVTNYGPQFGIERIEWYWHMGRELHKKTQDKPKLDTYKPPRAEIHFRNLLWVSLRTRNPLDLIWIIAGGLVLICGATAIVIGLYEDSSYVDEFEDICFIASTLTCLVVFGIFMLWGGLTQAAHMSGFALKWHRHFKEIRKNRKR